MNRMIKFLLIGVTVFFLSSCATAPLDKEKDFPEMDTGMQEEEIVKTYGIGDEENLIGSDVGPKEGKLNTRSFYFAFDKYALNPKDSQAIKEHARYLLSHPSASVVIEGNTDARGSREYNIGLGHRRANAVANVLKASGVPSKQVRTLSYGEERPVALGHTEEAYRLNRRSDIVYETN